MKRRGRVAGLGRVFVVSRRVALGLAALLALRAWSVLDQGTWLPGSIQNLLVGLVFFVVFPLAWAIGAFGGTLGWFAGRRQDRAEFGAAAGVFGFWVSLAIGGRLAQWLDQVGHDPWLPGLLFLALPLFGPWVVVRWLGDPLLRAWSAARSRLLDLSRFLGERLVLQRPFYFDARGLVLGLIAGLIAAGAAFAGLFRVPEAVALAQGIHVRNEPIKTAVGSIELSRLFSRGSPVRPVLPPGRGIVLLQIDDGAEEKLIRETSQAAVNARLLRKLAQWRSGPVILPISPTTLTTAPSRASQRGSGSAGRGPGRAPESPRERPRFGRPGRGVLAPPERFGRRESRRRPRIPFRPDRTQPGATRGTRGGPVLLNPTSPPLDTAALAREKRDIPELVRALRANEQAVLCPLPEQRLPGGMDQALARALLRGMQESVPVPTVVSLPVMDELLASGRPVGSAELSSYFIRQVQSLRLTDARGRWALPLLLATGGDQTLVFPPPTTELTGTLSIRGRRLPLAAPGRILINLYGSRPGAIFPTASYSAILSGGRLYDRRVGQWVPPEQFFRDQIVFLDTLNQPSYDTPMGPFRATELLAMAVENVLGMNVLAPPAARIELLFLLLWGALAGHLAIGRSPLAGALRVALLVSFSWLMAAILFVLPGVWLPVVSVTAAMGLAYLLTLQFVMASEARELEQHRNQNARLEQEVIISRAIQTSLLPPGHLREGDFELLCRSDPAREVGGDFYNTFTLAPAGNGYREAGQAAPAPSSSAERIGIVLGDVSGKGVQGAMYMTVATTLLEACAEREMAPEEVLAVANAHLYPKIHRLRMFVTAFYGVLEVATGRLELASAGQVPPVVARRGESPCYQPTRGLPLGALRQSRYERQSLILAPGDALVLASDGLTEARNSRGRALGYDGFLDIVSRHVAGDPADCIARIFDDVGRFSGPADDQDDRTLVLIRHRGSGSAR